MVLIFLIRLDESLYGRQCIDFSECFVTCLLQFLVVSSFLSDIIILFSFHDL